MDGQPAPHIPTDLVESTSRMLREIFPAFAQRNGDPRFSMLLALLQTLQQRYTASELAELSTEGLVAHVVEAIHSCRFPVASYQTFKTLSEEDSRPVFVCYADAILKVLMELAGDGDGTMTIVSIGCGSGDIERFLNTIFQTWNAELKTLPWIGWVGLDRTLPDPASFFSTEGNRFVSADLKCAQPFLALAGVPPQEWSRTVLIASYAFHHFGLHPATFLQRCEGSARTVLLEELTTGPAWDQWIYRVARIGCDLLSNIGFNPDWARDFLAEPGQFQVRYLFREEVAPLGGRIIDVAGCSPEMSVVIF